MCIRNESDIGARVGPPEDLYIQLNMLVSPYYKRDGLNIYSVVKFTYLDAILTKIVEVKTVNGDISLTVEGDTQLGNVTRISGWDEPKRDNEYVRGNHFVSIKVKILSRLIVQTDAARQRNTLVTACKHKHILYAVCLALEQCTLKHKYTSIGTLVLHVQHKPRVNYAPKLLCCASFLRHDAS